MTSEAARVDRPARKALGRRLLAAGTMSPDWAPVFAAVDRAAFLPELMWPFDVERQTTAIVDRNADAESWYAAADGDAAIVTQWDDGEHTGTRPGRLSTSSSSAPSVVYSLLTDLAPEDGMRVLDVGTGTGETAAALTRRCGTGGRVATVEVDPAVSRRAGERLRAAGLHPEVIAGDGTAGHAGNAPYDRVLATMGLREIPGAWIEQTRRGGTIVAPWGTHFTHADAVVRLTAEGRTASGRFTRPVEFMKARTQRRPRISASDYLPPEGVGSADTSTTDLTEDRFLTGSYTALPFVLGLRVPDCVQAVADKRDGRRPVWFYGTGDRSWACVLFRDDAQTRVWQSGARRLWDELEAAHRWWTHQGEPGHTRFGLTVTADGQYAWLDDPAHSWRL